MLRNYIKTTLRSLVRNGSNTFINVFGLSLGITCSLVLFLLVSFLLSYDQHHENRDKIYRVVHSSNDQQGVKLYGNGVPAPMSDAIKEEISGIDQMTFVSNKYGSTLVTVGDKPQDYRYFEENENVAYTEKSYFDIFTSHVLLGSTEAFDESSKVILSEELATKYFGSIDVIGKELILDKEYPLEVIAVVKDAPRNSDFPFNMFISYATIKQDYIKHGWGSVSSDDQIYLLLAESTTSESINEQLVAFKEKQFPEDDQELHYFLQPITTLHSDTRFNNYRYSTVSEGNMWTMALVGIFILITACINFINISTAVAIKRSKEIGVRKVLGSTRDQLMCQFLGETFLVVLTAVIASLGLAELLLIKINPMLEIDLGINWFTDGKIEIFLASVLILVTLLSGLYPAMIMARQRPAVVIKNSHSAGNRTAGFSIRKVLVAFQFVITPFFIIGTLVLIHQMKFIQSTDLGFKSEAIVALNLPSSEPSKKKALKTRVQNIPGVERVSLSSRSPLSGSISVTDINLDGDEQPYYADVKWADVDYLETYGISVLAGEGLNDVDTMNRILVNEEFLKVTGMSEPDEALGRMVQIWGDKVPITGVVGNFYSRNLRMKLEPVIIVNGVGNSQTLSIGLDGGNYKEQIRGVARAWKEVYPEYTFDYEFVDQAIAEMYESEQEMTSIFSFFSFVAIFIGCLGLYGLVSYTTSQKVKEIGIRKALGASVKNILTLVSKDFMLPVLLGFIIAAPLAWYLMNLWLQNYEYRIDLGAGIFIMALLATITIAILTTGYKSLVAARANPVDSLRDD